MAGGDDRADWVRNLLREPRVSMEIAGVAHDARARVVERDTGEDARARQLMLAKYQRPGANDLESWGTSALVVALDLS